MNSTKKRILEISRSLFNKKGYKDVSIRMIATELNMSSGNLNYHYKKREDILEALYFEMVSTFDKRIDDLEVTNLTLKSMKTDIYNSMKRMVNYQFFWTDLHHLLQQNSNIKNHFDTVYNRRIDGFLFVINSFINSRILRPFETDFEKTQLISQMVNFGNTWMYASVLYKKNKLTTSFIKTQTSALMAYLYPYLTDLGKDQFKLLFPNYFIKT